MMQRGTLLALALFAAAAGNAQQPSAEFTAADRLQFEMRGMAGLGSIASGLAVAGIQQWRGEPREWRQGAAGYGRRLGYYSAQLAAAQALEFGIGAHLNHDPRPEPSKREGVWPRTWHALKHTFVARDGQGQVDVMVYRFAGSYGGAFLSNLWYPSRLNGPGDALIRGSWGLAGAAGSSVAREFWPDIKRRLLREKH